MTFVEQRPKSYLIDCETDLTTCLTECLAWLLKFVQRQMIYSINVLYLRKLLIEFFLGNPDRTMCTV